MIIEDKAVSQKINENYVHWDEIQTRINTDHQFDFDDPIEADDSSRESKNFLPLISESDLNDNNEILFKKQIIRKIQEQKIDSNNFSKYSEEQRVMKSFIPFIEDDKHSGDYARSLRNKFQDFVQIPYFYHDIQANKDFVPESSLNDVMTKSISHTLANSKVNLFKNADNEIEAIEIECNCGEKTRIELQFED